MYAYKGYPDSVPGYTWHLKIAARMILELGAELISSDAIALYELVKNAVDAGSKWVSITMQIVLKRSYFLEAIEAIDGERRLKIRP